MLFPPLRSGWRRAYDVTMHFRAIMFFALWATAGGGVAQTSQPAAFGNITDRESLVEAMPDSPDSVFHVAGNTNMWSEHDAQQYQDNVVGTGHMLDVALRKRAKRFVYTSSISSYGYQPGCRLDESTP